MNCKKLFFLTALLCVVGLAKAQTVVTEVGVTLDLNDICLNEGVPEGYVQYLILQNVSTGEGQAERGGNLYLQYLNGSSWWGISNGVNNVSAARNYGIEFSVFPKTGFVFPANASDIICKVNGNKVTPQSVRFAGSNLFYFVVTISDMGGAVGTATLPTLTATNALWNEYPSGIGHKDGFTSGKFPEGAGINLKAKEIIGKRFTGWNVTGVTLTPEQLAGEELHFAMPNGDVTAEAQYTEVELTTISELNLAIDFAAINLVTGQTQGEVDGRVASNVTIAPTENYTIANAYLGWLNGSSAWGINDEEMVSLEKTYLLVIILDAKTDCVFNRLAPLTLNVNGNPAEIHAASSFMNDTRYCLNIAITAKEPTTTALETVASNAKIFALNGRIFGAENAHIYDILGRDVTKENGNLKGVYIVGKQKVIVQ